MAKRKKSVGGKRRKVTQKPAAKAISPPPTKEWTFLLYMCGDTDELAEYIRRDFDEVCQVGSLPDIHVVVQCDFPEGASRYCLPEGPMATAPRPDSVFGRRHVNTGRYEEAVRFLRWGLKQAPSRHVAVVFSGLGINPEYVRQLLQLEDVLSDDADSNSADEQVAS